MTPQIHIVAVPADARDFIQEGPDLISYMTGRKERIILKEGNWTFLGCYQNGKIDFEPTEKMVSDEPLPHIFSDNPDKNRSEMFKEYVAETFVECRIESQINEIYPTENPYNHPKDIYGEEMENALPSEWDEALRLYKGWRRKPRPEKFAVLIEKV